MRQFETAADEGILKVTCPGRRGTGMKIIQGLTEAKKMLSRQAGFVIPEPSLRLKNSLQSMFGTTDPARAVEQIIKAVQQRGDAALLEFTAMLDHAKLATIEVPVAEVAAAPAKISPPLLAALRTAHGQVQKFHQRQRDAVLAGARLMVPSTVIRVLPRVGLYIPGGTASYPSSVLMTAVPAKVAGVPEVVMATPPGKDGRVPVNTLAAASLAGVDRVFAIGGAQAIAAMAYGTATVPGVDKICGPGNLFVMLAKKQVYGVVDIDGLQGPSEVVVIADGTANPVWCAGDILAQAEHDTLAQSILITTSEAKWQAIEKEINSSLETLERKEIIAESLREHGVVAIVANVEEAITLANLYAPEHLCLYVADAADYAERVQHAGCVFIGEHPTVVMGDYVAGPSHTLPTSGTARFASPLNVTDFIRYMNIVDVSAKMLMELGPAAAALAGAEGLTAHARAVRPVQWRKDNAGK
jgi:histidinol dehydrogenase